MPAIRRRAMIASAVLLPALAVLALLAYGFGREPRYIESPMLGRPAPPFALTLFDGQTLRLEDLRGRVVLLNFWASWCPPCRAEAPMLEAMWAARFWRPRSTRRVEASSAHVRGGVSISPPDEPRIWNEAE